MATKDATRRMLMTHRPRFHLFFRQPNRKLVHAARVLAPTLLALTFAGAAHAQGTMDFSGAQTLMGTFNGRFAYVSVSRAAHDAQLYTDSAAALAPRLSHEVTKSSALSTAEDHCSGFRAAGMITRLFQM
jgi:hypothetical protein